MKSLGSPSEATLLTPSHKHPSMSQLHLWSVMANFMCYLNWTTMPRYWVKHSGCIYEGAFG